MNFHALRFQPRIYAMGRLLIDRMRSSSSEYNSYRSRKSSQAGFLESDASKESVGVALGAEKRLGRHVLQTKEGVTSPEGEMAGRTLPLDRDGKRGDLVEDSEVDRKRRLVALPDGAVEIRSKGLSRSGEPVEGFGSGENTLGTRSWGDAFESRGTETVRLHIGIGGLPVEGTDRVETRGEGKRRLLAEDAGGEDDNSHLPEAVQRYSKEMLVESSNGKLPVATRGDGKRRLLAEVAGGEDDISHLPEAVQRYMRNQRLRDERKRKQQEQSARAGARPGRDLGKDETLAVLERDEGMEVVHLKTALILGDDSKGLAEKTRVAPAVGDEITVADPEKPEGGPARRAEFGSSGERLGVSGVVERSGFDEEERWPVRFVALHANFPAKLAAFSMCDFGGGEKEKKELRRLREAQFEALARWERNGK